MSLGPGVRLGAYEIVSLLGAGGMGEVYRASDANLGRQVAIKVLPEEFSTDPERLARFEREARTLATLNHPNISTIHGLEKANGISALVMELVEGPTLADRIAQGPIPLDEAVPIAKQIAEALEAAHELGIIHRDLKPANIKVRPDGAVKVLDFGLAKALDHASGSGLKALGQSGALVSRSPTISSPAFVTGGGVLLGTAAYMSPEQAKGRAADRRSDVWAFGCVMYEMLTGKPPFAGEDVAEVLAAILRSDPLWSALPSTTPPSIRRLLRRALEKNPRQRLQHTGDARIELEGDIGSDAPVSNGTNGPRKLMFVAGGVVLGVIATLGWFMAHPIALPPSSMTRLTVITPAGANLSTDGAANVVVSPDGRLLAFTVERPRSSIYIRPLDSFEAYGVRGTEDGTAPFFSPDGAWLGFTSDRKLKRVPIAGGLPVTIYDFSGITSAGLTGTWLDDGTIVFSLGGELHRVSAEGGPAQPLKTSSPLFDPVAIPGMQAILARKGVGATTRHQVVAIDLSDGLEKLLTFGLTPKLAPSGDVLFVENGTLWRAGFDKERLSVLGTPVPLVEGVRVSNNQRAVFGVSRTGTLAYVPVAATASRTLVWLDRLGTETIAVRETAPYLNPRVSPDGRAIAVTIVGQGGGNIWTLDLERGTRLPLTTVGSVSRPVWSPDGTTVTFQNNSDVHSVSASGGTATTLLALPGTQFPDTWTPDGKTLIYNEGGSLETRDLWMVRPGDTPQPVVRTRFGERGATMAPNGKWLAFVSTDAGRDDVYVTSFPPSGTKLTISPSGGWQPVWSRDGRELFFRQEDWMMVAPVQMEPFRVGVPRRLFQFERRFYGDNPNVPDYDVAPDGRFLAIQQSGDPQNEIRVIANWADLK